MPTLNELFPSNRLKAEDAEHEDLILTIDHVDVETFDNGAKPVLYFRNEKRSLVLNKTNAQTIAKLHGNDTDQWAGKRIALYATEVEFKGDTVLGLRVRLRAPKPAAAKPVPAGTDDDDELEF